RLLVAVAVGVGLILAFPAVASAGPRVDRQAWSATGPLAPPSPQSDSIYVSVVAGQEQARSFVHVDVSDADQSQLSAAKLVLTEASDGTMASSAKLKACALATPFTGSGKLSGDAPTTNCELTATLRRADDGRWTLPLATFATALYLGTSQGLAILPDVQSPADSATVSFDSAKTTVDAPPATS